MADRDRDAQRAAENQQRIRAIKTERGCIDCGTRQGRLEFDHRDGKQKRFAIGNASTRAWNTIEAEIAKCDVRCASCHQQRHLRDDPTKMVRAGRAGGAAGRGRKRPWQTPEWYAKRKRGAVL